MKLISTRDDRERPRGSVSDFRHAVFSGLAPDGGLWVPTELPQLTPDRLAELSSFDWPQLAVELAHELLHDEVPAGELADLVRDALDFEIPLVQLEDDTWVLELFHGPTLAFKDVAARFLARIMAWAAADDSTSLIVLVATSGDTGSAVAHAFYEVPGVEVKVLYPKGKVSEAQRKLFTTLGKNVESLEVAGTFDDCQAMVKAAFRNRELRQQRTLASANSINIGRLLPQTFYYFWAANQLRREIGDNAARVRFCTPSGNFGNLTAGLMARQMGLPCGRFLAATNRNDVVPSYLERGLFEPRPSIATLSNAMDVGNPSNFSRIAWFYDQSVDSVRDVLEGYAFDDQETLDAMKRVHDQTGYVLDPHTAVGYLGRQAARKRRDQAGAPAVILATAHPGKFQDTVEQALGQPFELPEELERCLALEESIVAMAPTAEALEQHLLT